MKKMKRFVALALSVVMVLAMSVMAFADETQQTYSLTINNSKTGHTYAAYQIFVGDLTVDNNGTKNLSNIKWGRGVTSAGQKVLGNADNKADTLKNEADAKAFSKALAVYLTNPISFGKDASSGNYTISGLKPGYYLVKDLSLENQENDVYTSYIMEVVGDTTAAPKGDVPSFEKKIKDINDTTDDDYTDWQDSADYDIGDNVPFKLEGTVASNYDDYEHYYFAFHDIEEAGLAFNKDSVKVYVDASTEPLDNTNNDYYTVAKPGTETTDKCTFEVVFRDLKQVPGVKAGSKIRVEYTSKLNEHANLGNQGNINKAKLEFSNNPNSDQGGTGETPWDNVIVFTYKVVVNKYANSVAAGNELSGAQFKLEKVFKDGSKQVVQNVDISEDKTSFTFKGLDDGNYILTETKTPAGYNTIAPMTFKVEANHISIWGAEERTDILTGLTGSKVTGEITLATTTDENAKPTGELVTNVINKSGSTLPSTGGIGTTIFYIVGGILMVGAAVLLITKRRAEN